MRRCLSAAVATDTLPIDPSSIRRVTAMCIRFGSDEGRQFLSPADPAPARPDVAPAAAEAEANRPLAVRLKEWLEDFYFKGSGPR